MKADIGAAVAFSILAAFGCSPASDTETDAGARERATEVSGDMKLAEAGETDACPVIESRGWRAWVDAMPNPDAAATLFVEGEVDMPTPGYSFAWEVGMADRSAVPTQRLHIKATPPDGMTAQVVTTETVRYEGPAIAQSYRSVIVMCGEDVLAEATPVLTAR